MEQFTHYLVVRTELLQRLADVYHNGMQTGMLVILEQTPDYALCEGRARALVIRAAEDTEGVKVYRFCSQAEADFAARTPNPWQKPLT